MSNAAVSVAPPAAASRSVLVSLALAAVYVIWGSTYFAMRIAIEYLPPFLMGAARFLTAGAVLFVVLRARGVAAPRPKEWAAAALVGSLLLAFGNGLVAIAERSIDSGVAATVIATVPLWTTGMAALFGERPSALECSGLLLGFVGIVVLRSGGSLTFTGWDTVALCLAPVSWALGAVLSKRLPLPSGLMATAAEMVAGGVVMLGVALVRGDRPVGEASFATVSALAYLVVFGSLVAFSAFGYLLRNTRPAVAMSYAYVNPLVALLIGSAFAGEALTGSKLFACTLTIAGVGMTTLGRRRAAKT